MIGVAAVRWVASKVVIIQFGSWYRHWLGLALVGVTKSQCNGTLFSLYLTKILVLSEMANSEMINAKEACNLWTECWEMLCCDSTYVYPFPTHCAICCYTNPLIWQSGTRYSCEGKNWLPRGLSAGKLKAVKIIMIHGLVFEVPVPSPVLIQHLPLFVSNNDIISLLVVSPT